MSNKSIYGATVPSTFKSDDGRFHYVYRITNIVSNKHYYGKRTTSIDPFMDLGTKYFSSSTDKEFLTEQESVPQNFKYKVIGIFTTSQGALELEIKLHFKFDVGVNESFFNKVRQTSTGFSTSGKVSVRDKDGNTFTVSQDDPRYISGELVSVSKGLGIFIDENGNNVQLLVDEAKERGLSGMHKGYSMFLDENGNNVHLPVEEAKQRNLVGVTKGYGVFLDENGKYIQLSIKEAKQRNLVGSTKGYGVFINECGNNVKMLVTEARAKGLKYANVGNVVIYENGTRRVISKEEFDSGNYHGSTIGLVMAKHSDGTTEQVKRDDPRLKSGEIKYVNHGRHWYHNPETNIGKLCDPWEIEDLIQQGWVEGYPKLETPFRYIWVTNGIDTKRVRDDELSNYKASGWRHGKAKNRTKLFHPKFGNKSILTTEVEFYISDG